VNTASDPRFFITQAIINKLDLLLQMNILVALGIVIELVAVVVVVITKPIGSNSEIFLPLVSGHYSFFL
jgi:hypothetical protein